MTNPIFEDKTELWDVKYVFLREGEGEGGKKKGGLCVQRGRVKLSKDDKVFFVLFLLLDFFL